MRRCPVIGAGCWASKFPFFSLDCFLKIPCFAGKKHPSKPILLRSPMHTVFSNAQRAICFNYVDLSRILSRSSECWGRSLDPGGDVFARWLGLSSVCNVQSISSYRLSVRVLAERSPGALSVVCRKIAFSHALPCFRWEEFLPSSHVLINLQL